MTAKAPLEDPKYQPQHYPIHGAPPDVVAKWGPRSQRRWFQRFNADLTPQPYDFWERFYCESEEHRGYCCRSCLDDMDEGYGGIEDHCCCRGLREDPAGQEREDRGMSDTEIGRQAREVVEQMKLLRGRILIKYDGGLPLHVDSIRIYGAATNDPAIVLVVS